MVLLIFSYLSSEFLKYSKILFLIVDHKAKTRMVGILHVAECSNVKPCECNSWNINVKPNDRVEFTIR